jgi:hypothetical protein
MRARTFVILCLYVASAALTVSLPGSSASAATGAVTVTPSTGLSAGDLITIAGSGFTPSVQVGVCQGIVAGTPGSEDCGSPVNLLQTDANGAFSTQIAARRFMTVGGQPIDCASSGAACMIGAAEVADIANTAVVAPITFLPASSHPRPDLIFKRRDTQQLLEDNQYFSNVSLAPQHTHPLVNGKWVYALVVQNDGDVTDDLVLTTPIVPSPPIVFDVFVGYYNVTAFAAGSGVVFHDVAPGQSFVVGVRFSAAPDVSGLGVLASVKLSSASAPELVDYSRLWVDTPTSG